MESANGFLLGVLLLSSRTEINQRQLGPGSDCKMIISYFSLTGGFFKWTYMDQKKFFLLKICCRLDRRGAWGRMDTCICMTESLFCPPITTLLILQYNIKGFLKRSSCFEGQTNMFIMDFTHP